MSHQSKPVGRRAATLAETRGKILTVAERLFADRGIESVSLRQIGAAAGAANHFVVQYHFGDKRKLVRAIFERRLPRLDAQRAMLLAELRRDGRADDLGALLEVVIRPLAEEVDSDGRHVHAAFLLSLHHFGQYEERVSASDLAPMTSEVSELLYAANSSIPLEVSRFRLISAFVLFLDALVRIDRERANQAITKDEEAAFVEYAVSSAKGAFSPS